MAQNLTVHVDHNPYLDGRMPAIVTLDWTSDSSGNVSKAIAATYAAAQLLASGNNPSVVQPIKIRGELAMVEVIPGANGDKTTNLPTAAYSITLLDKYGYDVTAGFLASNSGTVAENHVPQNKFPQIDSELTLTIASAGSGGKGRIIIHFKESENRP